MTNATSLAIALNLAARGTPVFFCLANKQPAVKGGFKSAVTDEQAVRYMYRRNPGSLVAIPTGPVSGFDVLDIDPKHGGDEWLMEHQVRIPATWVNRTRSGGEHWLFRHAPGVRNTQSKIAPGVDTRGEGGYIIWWPGLGGSVEQKHALAAWPDWLLSQLLPRATPLAPDRKWLNRAANDDTAARRLIQRQIEKVAHAAPGERHCKLRNAALIIGGVLDLDPCATRSDIAGQLLSAVIHAGGDDVRQDNAKATIAWGLEQGAKRPLHAGGQHA